MLKEMYIDFTQFPSPAKSVMVCTGLCEALLVVWLSQMCFTTLRTLES